jgi:hypothetical protein
MYCDEKRSLQYIGEHLGVSRETVRSLLKAHSIDRRPRGVYREEVARYKEEIVRLYVEEELKILQIASRIGLSVPRISKVLRAEGVKVLRGGQNSILFPELGKLKVGESLELPRVGGSVRNKYSRYYIMARRLNIRVRIRTISDEKVLVTRVT